MSLAGPRAKRKCEALAQELLRRSRCGQQSITLSLRQKPMMRWHLSRPHSDTQTHNRNGANRQRQLRGVAVQSYSMSHLHHDACCTAEQGSVKASSLLHFLAKMISFLCALQGPLTVNTSQLHPSPTSSLPASELPPLAGKLL